MNAEAPKTKHGDPGLLIVVEGTDGSGRSTQIQLLKQWLECEGYGVMVSEWNSSPLIAPVLREAKERNLLCANTFSLMYASDFAFRLENQVLPALQAGFIVIMDRYTYTAYARDVVRGARPDWVRKLYDYAPEPDIVFYIDIPVKTLMKRIIGTKGFDYYRSGRDIGLSTDFYESFKMYQDKILVEYSKMVEEYKFVTIEGTKSIVENHEEMKKNVQELLDAGFLS